MTQQAKSPASFFPSVVTIADRAAHSDTPRFFAVRVLSALWRGVMEMRTLQGSVRLPTEVMNCISVMESALQYLPEEGKKDPEWKVRAALRDVADIMAVWKDANK